MSVIALGMSHRYTQPLKRLPRRISKTPREPKQSIDCLLKIWNRNSNKDNSLKNDNFSIIITSLCYEVDLSPYYSHPIPHRTPPMTGRKGFGKQNTFKQHARLHLTQHNFSPINTEGMPREPTSVWSA